METVGFQDMTIECRICQVKFTWCEGEQQFYHDHGLSQPRKCPDCRADMKRKFHRQNEERRVREEAQHGR